MRVRDCSDIIDRRVAGEVRRWPALSFAGCPIPRRSASARAVRHKRSLEAEVRMVLERAAQEAVASEDRGERFPDWFIRMTRPGIDLDAAIEENRLPHEGVEL